MSHSKTRQNIFFPLTALLGAVFIITILAFTASMLGDQRAPVSKIIQEYAGIWLGIEAGGTIALGFIALTVDRRQTLQDMQDKEAHPQNPEDSGEGTEI